MKEIIEKVRNFIHRHKDLLIVGVIAYIIHLTVEGLLANLIYYKAVKPILAAV